MFTCLVLKERSFIDILGPRISKDDLLMSTGNTEIMRAYIRNLMSNVHKAVDLISCKEHRVGSLHPQVR